MTALMTPECRTRLPVENPGPSRTQPDRRGRRLDLADTLRFRVYSVKLNDLMICSMMPELRTEYVLQSFFD